MMRKFLIIGLMAAAVSVSTAVVAHANNHFCPDQVDLPFWQYLMKLDHSVAEVSAKDRAAYLKVEEKFSAAGDGYAMCTHGIDRFYGERRKQDFDTAAINPIIKNFRIIAAPYSRQPMIPYRQKNTTGTCGGWAG